MRHGENGSNWYNKKVLHSRGEGHCAAQRWPGGLGKQTASITSVIIRILSVLPFLSQHIHVKETEFPGHPTPRHMALTIFHCFCLRYSQKHLALSTGPVFLMLLTSSYGSAGHLYNNPRSGCSLHVTLGNSLVSSFEATYFE